MVNSGLNRFKGLSGLIVVSLPLPGQLTLAVPSHNEIIIIGDPIHNHLVAIERG